MRRLLFLATAFVVLGSILVLGQAFAAGTFVPRVQAQDVDANGNACIDENEFPIWREKPVLLAGPPTELADPDLPRSDVGPSVWEFTLSEGEIYRGGCGETGEIITVTDGRLTLTIPGIDRGSDVPSYVTFAEGEPGDRCVPLDSNPRACLLEPGGSLILVSGDIAYHPEGALYEYVPGASAQASPTDGAAAGAVRASGAPLAQTNATMTSFSKGSKPFACDGDCRP